MRLEVYAPRGSAVHELHPAVKLGLLVLFIAGPFLTRSTAGQALALGAAFAVAAGGRVLDVVLAPWKLLAFIFLMTYVVWGLSSDWYISSLAYALRVTGVFVLGLAFLATTRTEETIHALEVFRVPYRLAFSLGLAFRLVPLFLQSAASIADAQKSRGLDVNAGSLAERLKKYVPLLVPIFMTSLRSADQMAMALDARGFARGGARTRLRRYPFGRAEAAALAVGAAYLALMLVARAAEPLLPWAPLQDAQVGEKARYTLEILDASGRSVSKTEKEYKVDAVEDHSVRVGRNEVAKGADAPEIIAALRLLPPGTPMSGLVAKPDKVGKRECVRVSLRAALQGGATNVEMDAWFAKDVPVYGLVRARTKIAGGGAGESVHELVE